MGRFQNILDEMTARQRPAQASPRMLDLNIPVEVGAFGAATTPAFAFARYADHLPAPDLPDIASSRPKRTPAPSPTPTPSLEQRLDEAEKRQFPVDRLNALRRQLAWECHPDRNTPDGDRLMTRVNERIDDLIVKARRRGA